MSFAGSAGGTGALGVQAHPVTPADARSSTHVRLQMKNLLLHFTELCPLDTTAHAFRAEKFLGLSRSEITQVQNKGVGVSGS